jgi:hypothetical protein
LGVRSTIIGHRGASGEAVLAGVGLDAPDVGDDGLHGRGHQLVHRVRLVPLDEVRRVAIPLEEMLQFLVADSREDTRVRDLVAVQVQDRQHHPVGHRVQELVGVPARGQGPGLRLAVADDAGDDEVGVVEGRAVGVRDRIAQLAALVDRARRLRRHVAGDPARERELGEETLHPLLVLRDVRVDLAVCPFEVRVGDQAGPAVSGPGDVDHVEVMRLDHAVEVDVDEVQAGGRPPVAEKPWLDVLLGQRPLEERVVVQIDLADRQVVGGPPVRVHECPFPVRQRLRHDRLLCSGSPSVATCVMVDQSSRHSRRCAGEPAVARLSSISSV